MWDRWGDGRKKTDNGERKRKIKADEKLRGKKKEGWLGKLENWECSSFCSKWREISHKKKPWRKGKEWTKKEILKIKVSLIQKIKKDKNERKFENKNLIQQKERVNEYKERIMKENLKIKDESEFHSKEIMKERKKNENNKRI